MLREGLAEQKLKEGRKSHAVRRTAGANILRWKCDVSEEKQGGPSARTQWPR